MFESLEDGQYTDGAGAARELKSAPAMGSLPRRRYGVEKLRRAKTPSSTRVRQARIVDQAVLETYGREARARKAARRPDYDALNNFNGIILSSPLLHSSSARGTVAESKYPWSHLQTSLEYEKNAYSKVYSRGRLNKGHVADLHTEELNASSVLSGTASAASLAKLLESCRGSDEIQELMKETVRARKTMPKPQDLRQMIDSREEPDERKVIPGSRARPFSRDNQWVQEGFGGFPISSEAPRTRRPQTSMSSKRPDWVVGPQTTQDQKQTSHKMSSFKPRLAPRRAPQTPSHREIIPCDQNLVIRTVLS